MQVTRQTSDSGDLLTATGRLDAQHADILAHEVEECIRAGSHRVRLDLTGVDYLSSAGIRVLVKYAKVLRGLGGGLLLAAASDAVQRVLDMTGMLGLFTAAAPTEAPAVPGDGRWADQTLGPVSYRVVARDNGAMTARLVGTPARLAGGAYAATDTASLSLGPTDVAVGLGAFATDFAAGRGRFGEFLAAVGVAVVLPPDAGGHPDFMVAQGQLRPEAIMLHALCASGGWAVQARFEAHDAASDPAGVGALAAVARELVAAPQVAVLMVAETVGLVGAALRRSPAAGERPPDPFAVADLRTWLSFTPERVHGRHLALVAGVLDTGAAAWLAPHVRPLGPELAGHLHAAVLTYRAIPAGKLDPARFIPELFDTQEVVDVLHLVNDTRGISGAGESLFSRGAIWLAPLTEGSRQ